MNGATAMRPACPHCQTHSDQPQGDQIFWRGHYFRACDRTWIRRYRCGRCRRSFSSSTTDVFRRTRRRDLHKVMPQLLSYGLTLRGLAHVFGASRTTIARKLRLLGAIARADFATELADLKPLQVIQFDEMETFEHTKWKPLSIATAVCENTRRILGFEVARMPARGLYAKRACEKYGRRRDGRARARRKLLRRLAPKLTSLGLIKSDKNPGYPPLIREILPRIEHQRFKGRRACTIGQGELKRGGFDPLFSFNHTAAMIRAHVSRLVRQTWCTTKKIPSLEDHLYIYANFHNNELLTLNQRCKSTCS